MSIASVKNDILSKESVINAFTPLAPTISSYNILVDAVIIDDTAIDTSGGQTIQINGTSFAQGAIITLDGSTVTTAYVSPNKLTFTAPVKTAGTYAIYVVNLDGGTAIYIPGLVYSGTPVWTSAAGSLGSIYETNSISTTAFTTTGDAPITYALYSGTLPVGSSLNTSTGVITGTAPVDSGSTVYSFTIKATDAQLQDSLQSFTLTINTDTVTWSSPANNSTTTLSQNTASTTALSASSAAGKSITYTSDTLPTGLSISGDSVTGSPTVLGSTTSLFTATAATSGRTATRTINWTITVANDVYFMYDSLLLSGGTSTSTFIADESVNNFALTIVGDTKPNNFNPYTPGYYSMYSPTTSAYYSYSDTTTGNFGTGDFTVESWFYATASAHNIIMNSVGTATWAFLTYGNQFYWQENGGNYGGGGYGTVPTNQWVHLAASRTGGYLNLYINGVRVLNSANTYNYSGTPTRYIGPAGGGSSSFWLSNVRFIKGTGIYSGATITVPTSPLTAIANTSLLTAQSNRMIDNSANAIVFTKAGSPTVQSFTPFVPNTAYAAYGSTYFDGNGDYLSTPQNAAFNLGTGAFTVEAWVYITASNGANQRIIGLGDGANGGGPYTGWSLVIQNSLTQISWYRYDGTETNLVVSYTFSVNTWYHVVAVRNGSSNLSLYVNGSRVYNNASATLSYNNVNSNPLYIGVTSDGSGGGYSTKYFNGYISNTRVVAGTAVYNPTVATLTVPTAPLTAVTGTSLLTLQTNQPVNNSVFLDNSTNALAITRAGNATQGTFSPYGANWSNYFDGTGDYLSSTLTAIGTNDFTVEYYSYLISHSGSNEESGYFQISGVNGGISTSYLVGVCAARASPGNGRVLAIYIGSSTILTTYVLPLNTWFHTAIVRQSNVVKVYINGTLVSTPATISTNLTGAYYAIGGYYSTTYLMNGYISNFRVISNTAIYTATFTTSTSPLTPISGTSVLTCQSNQIIDNSINNSTITKNGDVSVQRFSPFAPQTQTANTHSAYFSTKTDFISVPATAALTTFTGDFTFECWVNPTDTSISTTWGIWDSRNSGQTASAMIFFLTGLASPVTGQWRLSYYNSGSQYYGTGVVYANQWTHVAFVRSGSTLTYYVNGVAGGTTSVGAGTISGSATSNPVYIGTKDGSLAGYGNVGYISNFRVVKGVAVYTGNFTVPTAPLTATQSSGTNIAAITGTQTSLLTCQSATLVDNSTNVFVITAGGTTKPRTLNPFGFTNTLAAYSAATYGASAYFDGTGDYLSVPDNVAFTMGSASYTLECWVYLNSISQQVFIGTCDAAGTQASMSFTLGVNSSALFTTGIGYAGTMYYSTFATAPTVGRWYHVAGVRNGATVNVYVDGVKGTDLNMAALAMTDSDQTVAIGRNGAGNFEYTNGYVSNARIVKGTAVYTSNFVPPAAPLTAITNTSLLLNMNSAGIYDSASMNDLETVADAKILATQTPYAGSYYSNYFDGTGDVFTVSNNSGFNFSGDFIIEAWLYPTAFGQASCNFMTHWSSGSNVYVFRVLNTGRLQFLYTSGATTLTGTSTTVSLNQWSHVAVCRSGSTLRIFVNGIADTTTATYSGTLTGGGLIAVGAHNDTSEGWTGYISNLRVVNTPSSPYTTTFTPSTTPLTSITGTALLTCQSNRFIDNSSNAGTITKSGNVAVQSFNPFQRNSATTLYFDGTGDYLKAPYNPAHSLPGDFTVETWLYLTSAAGTGNQTIASFGYLNSTGAGPWGFYLNGSGPYTLYFNTTSANHGSSTTVAIPINAWTHVTYCRTGSTGRFFVNGTIVGTTISDTSTYSGTTQSLFVGIMSDGSTAPLYGYLNDLRITKGLARYTTNFTPSTTALLTY